MDGLPNELRTIYEQSPYKGNMTFEEWLRSAEGSINRRIVFNVPYGSWEELFQRTGSTEGWSPYAKYALEMERAGRPLPVGQMGWTPDSQPPAGRQSPPPDTTSPPDVPTRNSSPSSKPAPTFEEFMRDLESGAYDYDPYDPYGRGSGRRGVRQFGRSLGESFRMGGWQELALLLAAYAAEHPPQYESFNDNNTGGTWYTPSRQDYLGNPIGHSPYWRGLAGNSDRYYEWGGRGGTDPGSYPTNGGDPGLRLGGPGTMGKTWDNMSGYLSVENNRIKYNSPTPSTGVRPEVPGGTYPQPSYNGYDPLSSAYPTPQPSYNGYDPLSSAYPTPQPEYTPTSTPTPTPIPTTPIPQETPIPSSSSSDASIAVATQNAQDPNYGPDWRSTVEALVPTAQPIGTMVPTLTP